MGKKRANDNVEPVTEVEEAPKEGVAVENRPSIYKGYEIRWLKREPTHPDYGLVAEYEEKYGEV